MACYLALDSATENCSVALSTPFGLFKRQHLGAKAHAEIILPMIDEVMIEAQVKKTDLDGIILGKGPGSFTGVRIAVSTAQGLALGLGLKIACVSSLKTLAHQALKGIDEDVAIAAIDARMGEIYVAVYAREQDGSLKALLTESVMSPDDALDAIKKVIPFTQAVCAGSGVELLQEVGLNKNILKKSHFPQAWSMIDIGLEDFKQGLALDPMQALPLYVRNDVTWKKVEQQ